MRHLLGTLVLLWVMLPSLHATPEEKTQPNSLTATEAAEGWILLFDGATSFGWTIAGESKVENGQLVLGGAKLTTATCTTGFGSFEARLDYLLIEGSESSQVCLGPGAVTFTNLGTKTIPTRGWHRIEQTSDVRPTGSRIATRAKDIDLTTGGSQESNMSFGGSPGPVQIKIETPVGTTVALRNIKLRLLGLHPLFNGKDLSGWKEVKTPKTKSQFTVTDKGELNIKNGPGDIQTLNRWDDFILQIDVFSNGPHLNSGVFFRCLPGEFWSGYEAQIRNQWKGDDRTQAVDYGTGGIYNRQPARKVVSNDHEWFTMTVAAQGNHLAVWVNGFQTADFTDTRPADRSARKGSKTGAGPISLQGHDPTTDLSFRNIRIADLPKKKD